MDGDIIAYLRARKNRSVTLGEMEKQAKGNTGYEEFSAWVTKLVEQGVLVPVKEHGFNGKPVPLANTYRIIKSKLAGSLVKDIEKYQFSLHKLIKLEAYFALPPSVWENDLPHILLIDSFLHREGLPVDEAAAPERSYRLVGDEKWIEYRGGRKILDRLGLWEDMKIVSRPDPLMLAVNPQAWRETLSLNLVLENKAPFYALLEILPGTSWLSLIYGAGWKITADIVMLEKQLGRQNESLAVEYFGDLDYEGISIWHALNDRYPAAPAREFYRALLARPAARGKDNQQRNDEALTHFLSYFSPEEGRRMMEVLDNGAYYPQEVLTRPELEEIGRLRPWKPK